MMLDPSSVRIAMEGPATIYEVKALRELLLHEIGKEGNVVIDLGESGKWDLAGIQLLVSCVRTVQRQGRNVLLRRVTRICADVAERSGLSEWVHSVSE